MRNLWEHKWIILLVAVLLVTAVISIVSVVNPGTAVGFSNFLGSILRPVQNLATTFNDWRESRWVTQEQFDEILSENQRLRDYAASVDEQSRLYDQALRENERLRELLGLVQLRQDFVVLDATVVARDLDNYARTLTLSRGEQDGMAAGMAAITESGYLVGVVSEVGRNWCTLRTLTDSDFACGAYIYRPALDGVCRGQFESMRSGKTTMIGLTPEMDVKIGDAVLTSGVGGLYPRDLGIGTISDVQLDPNGMSATALLTPHADLRYLEQVFVLLSFDGESDTD